MSEKTALELEIEGALRKLIRDQIREYMERWYREVQPHLDRLHRAYLFAARGNEKAIDELPKLSEVATTETEKFFKGEETEG